MDNFIAKQFSKLKMCIMHAITTSHKDVRSSKKDDDKDKIDNYTPIHKSYEYVLTRK